MLMGKGNKLILSISVLDFKNKLLGYRLRVQMEDEVCL